MKIEVRNTKVIDVEFPDSRMTFSDKDALVNHLTNKVKSLQNCIAHYEKELIRLKVELAPKLEQLEQATKTDGLP